MSLLLHGLIAALLLFDLPEPLAETEPPEEVVTVAIVPPPEPEPEPEPEEPAPEAAAPEAPEPEPVEQAAAEPPPGPAEEQPEDEGVPIPVLRPVFQFGEEDQGPEIAPDGGAAQAPGEEAPGEEAPAGEPPAQPEIAETPPAEEPPVEDLPAEDAQQTPPEPSEEPAAETTDTAEPDRQPADPAPTLAMPDDIALPDAELAGDTPGALPEAAAETELASLPEDLAPEDLAPENPAPENVPEAATVVPEPKPARPAEPAKPDTSGAIEAPAERAPARDNGLPGVRQLSSSVDTGHAVATTAMRNMPRDARGTQLCTTELREQLRRSPESYRVELLPAYRLPGGTVLSVPKAAFRAGGAWYDLSFRCTVDADALRVVDFSFKVGAPIPRAQWRQRGFPEL